MNVKVVTIISRMNVGGPAVLLSKLIQEFPSDKVDHTLITGVCFENEVDYLETHPLNSNVIYLNDIKRKLLPTSDFKSFVKLVRLLKVLNPDVVHTHTSKAGVIGRLAARLAKPNVKIIHTYHGHLLYGYFSPFKTKIIIIIERILSKISNSLIAVSEKVKEDLLSVGIGPKEKWVVIHAGLEVRDPTTKMIYPDDLTNFRVTWIGRFTDIINPKLAIDAMRRIPPNIREHIQFQMVGDGELLADSKNYATEHGINIDFPGWVTDIEAILTETDLLLMTSRNEGMPVVIIEAALLNVPCLSTDVGGVGEFIKDQITGFLANEEPDDLADKISYLFNVPTLVHDAGQHAYDFMKANFSLENSTRKHIDLYQNLMLEKK